MKEITSRKNRKVQFVTETEWVRIKELGWADRFIVKDMPERKLKGVPIIPPAEKKLVIPKSHKK